MNHSSAASLVVQRRIPFQMNGRPAGQLPSLTWATHMKNVPGSGKCQRIDGQSPGPGAQLGPMHLSWVSGKRWLPGASSRLWCNISQLVMKHTKQHQNAWKEKQSEMGPTQLTLADVRPVGVAHDKLWLAAYFLWSRKSMKGDCCEVTHVQDGCVHIPGILICCNTHNQGIQLHSRNALCRNVFWLWGWKRWMKRWLGHCANRWTELLRQVSSGAWSCRWSFRGQIAQTQLCLRRVSSRTGSAAVTHLVC